MLLLLKIKVKHFCLFMAWHETIPLNLLFSGETVYEGGGSHQNREKHG